MCNQETAKQFWRGNGKRNSSYTPDCEFQAFNSFVARFGDEACRGVEADRTTRGENSLQ
jgi:hypothetical protein